MKCNLNKAVNLRSLRTHNILLSIRISTELEAILFLVEVYICIGSDYDSNTLFTY